MSSQKDITPSMVEKLKKMTVSLQRIVSIRENEIRRLRRELREMKAENARLEYYLKNK